MKTTALLFICLVGVAAASAQDKCSNLYAPEKGVFTACIPPTVTRVKGMFPGDFDLLVRSTDKKKNNFLYGFYQLAADGPIREAAVTIGGISIADIKEEAAFRTDAGATCTRFVFYFETASGGRTNILYAFDRPKTRLFVVASVNGHPLPDDVTLADSIARTITLKPN